MGNKLIPLILIILLISAVAAISVPKFQGKIENLSGTDSSQNIAVDESGTQTKSSILDTIDDFKYPGSSVTSSSGNSLTLKSSDGVDSITSWYKEGIKSLGYNTKSFVTTKTNNRVLTKLSGIKNDSEIMVEISKEPNETEVIVD